jgi:hypothetical protein
MAGWGQLRMALSGEWSGRAFWRAFGPRRLRRQSEPALVATQGGAADVPRLQRELVWPSAGADRPRWCVWWTGEVRSRGSIYSGPSRSKAVAATVGITSSSACIVRER